MKKTNTRLITMGAAIAALYVVLTLIANAFGLANYAIQVRFSEALTILPYFTPVAIPGLFAGCIISNILTGAMPLDVIFGSLATLIGAIGTNILKKKFPKIKWLAPLPPIIANTIVVPCVSLCLQIRRINTLFHADSRNRRSHFMRNIRYDFTLLT